MKDVDQIALEAVWRINALPIAVEGHSYAGRLHVQTRAQIQLIIAEAIRKALNT